VIVEIMLPITTIILSFVALFIAIFTWRANLRASRRIQHYNFAAHADTMLAENKTCLRFHGINPDTIEDLYGVTSAELSYLLQSFNAGSISNLLSNDGYAKPWERGSYYYDILKSEHTQKAFPLLQLLFDSKNHFIVRCEKTIHVIKRMNASSVCGKGI